MATKNKLFPQGALVAVEWIDACSLDEWTEKGEIDLDPAPILSVGIVLAHTDEAIKLALNHDPVNDSFSCLMAIGKGMIVKIRELKYAKAKTVQAKSRRSRSKI